MSFKIDVDLFCPCLFRVLWHQNGLQSNLATNVFNDINYFPFCFRIAKAVSHRQLIFKNTLSATLGNDYEIFSKSEVKFNMYFKNRVSYFIVQGNIFDQTIMSLAVVLQMCTTCFCSGNNSFLEYSSRCWRVYFETSLKDRFYAEGGWEQLESCAFSHKSGMLEINTIYKALIFNDDLLNVRNLMKYANHDYNMHDVSEYFKQRIVERGEFSCSNCLPLFYAFSDICSKTKQTSEKQKTIEGYLQIFLRMLSPDQIESIKLTFNHFRIMKLNEIRNKRTDSAISGLASSQSELFLENYLASDKVNSVINCHLKTTMTKLLLGNLFKDNGDLFNECLFCGENNKLLSTENFNVENPLKVINSVIQETVNNVGAISADEKQISMDSSTDISDDKCIEDVLKLFLTLGVQPRTSKMLAHSRINSVRKNNSTELKKKSSQNSKQDPKQDSKKK